MFLCCAWLSKALIGVVWLPQASIDKYFRPQTCETFGRVALPCILFVYLLILKIDGFIFEVACSPYPLLSVLGGRGYTYCLELGIILGPEFISHRPGLSVSFTVHYVVILVLGELSCIPDCTTTGCSSRLLSRTTFYLEKSMCRNPFILLWDQLSPV